MGRLLRCTRLVLRLFLLPANAVLRLQLRQLILLLLLIRLLAHLVLLLEWATSKASQINKRPQRKASSHASVAL